MQFFILKKSVAALGAIAALAHNSITFVSHDDDARILAFTNNPGHVYLTDIDFPGGSAIRVDFPDVWSGTIMAKKTDSVVPINRVLAEITFAPKMTYYDISAIDNQTDNSGIRFISPYGLPKPSILDLVAIGSLATTPISSPRTHTPEPPLQLISSVRSVPRTRPLQRAHDSIRGRFGLGLPSVSAT